VAFRAFIDAQILVEARPRDVLLTLAESGTFEPLWSQLVLEEMARHLPATMTDDHRSYLIGQMNAAFPEALVDWSGFVDIDVRLAVNAKDRHVAAAAVIGGADVILTEDDQFFQELRSSNLCDVQKLPEFIAYAIDADQPRARFALIEMATRRWGADDERDAEERLKAYFIKRGWNPDGLGATRRPRGYRW
jgi:PIN domain